jgi:hypothetical protein
MTRKFMIGGLAFTWLTAFTWILAGCSAPGTSPTGTGGTGGAAGSGGAGGTGGSPDMAGDSGTPNGSIALPFQVSDQFVPSGFMGDSPTDFNAVKMSPDATMCASRDPSAKGSCYTVAWTPSFLSGAKSAWVGVYWQYPANNWGGKAGKDIATGAAKVSFLAKGGAGGEALTFLAGGINTKGGDPTLTYSDSFSATLPATLTTSWTRYEIPLSGQTYSSVLGGFGWSITTSTTSPVTFYVDDITWE